MADRSSRPHRSPRRTPTRTERRIIKVRVLPRWGPARIAYLLGLNPATVHRVLTRYRLARLTHLDRATGRVIRRYERDRPGSGCTSTSRSSATSPTAADTRPSDARRAANPIPAHTRATTGCTSSTDDCASYSPTRTSSSPRARSPNSTPASRIGSATRRAAVEFLIIRGPQGERFHIRARYRRD